MDKDQPTNKSRRVDAPKIGPAEADGPEPELSNTDSRANKVGEQTDREAVNPAGIKDKDDDVDRGSSKKRVFVRRHTKNTGKLSERDQWMLEQRPPHW